MLVTHTAGVVVMMDTMYKPSLFEGCKGLDMMGDEIQHDMISLIYSKQMAY